MKAHDSCPQTGTHAHMTLLELACQQQASSLVLRTMQTKVRMLSPGILVPMMQQLQKYVVYNFLYTLHTIKSVQTQGSKGTGQISRRHSKSLLQGNVRCERHQTTRAYLCSGCATCVLCAAWCTLRQRLSVLPRLTGKKEIKVRYQYLRRTCLLARPLFAS